MTDSSSASASSSTTSSSAAATSTTSTTATKRQTLPRATTSSAAAARTRPWAQSDFKVGPALGQGKFGYVYSATALASRKQVALKILPKAQLRGSTAAMLQLRREVQIHSRLPAHANIVSFLGYFHDPKQVFIVLEKCARGHLYGELCKRGALPAPRAASYTRQIARALRHCHARGVVHRDLKPENILVDSDGTLKLADFGWAVHVPGALDGTRTTLCGSPAYVSPEIVDRRPHGHWTDLWSLGVMVHEMVFASLPFEASSQEGMFARIRAVDLPAHLRDAGDAGDGSAGVGGDQSMGLVPRASTGVKQLIRGLLQHRQKMRWPLDQVLSSAWVLAHSES